VAPELLGAVPVGMAHETRTAVFSDHSVFIASVRRLGVCRAERGSSLRGRLRAAARRRRAHGVSLLEVLVAMATAAVVVSVPQFQALRSVYGIRAAAHQVTAGVERARLRAIARNARHRVTFAVSGTTYVMEREVTPNTFVAEGGTQQLPLGVTVGAVSPAAPIFDTRGMLAAPVSISLSGTASRTKAITINALGQASIQ
jgi:pilin/secretion family protein with methylation motif